MARIPPVWTLIYDGDCRFCAAAVRLLRRWDRRRRVETVPFQDEEALAHLPPIPRAELEAAMQLVSPEGRIAAGAGAARALLPLLPGGRLLAVAFAVPGMSGLAAAVYRWVARRRHRLWCGSAACRRGRTTIGGAGG